MSFDGTGKPYEQPPFWKIILVLIIVVVVITAIWALLTGTIRIG